MWTRVNRLSRRSISFPARRSKQNVSCTRCCSVQPELPPEYLQYQQLPLRSQPLGDPLPGDEHACSVSLPTWGSVVGYEEGCPITVGSMKCGYPRFVYHPYVIQLMDSVLVGKPDKDCLVLPSKASALRCRAFLRQAILEEQVGVDNCTINDDTPLDEGVDGIELQELACGVCALIFPAQTMWGTTAKSYWQHGGEVVSSRRAADALRAVGVTTKPVCTSIPPEDQTLLNTTDDPFKAVKSLISEWTDVPSDSVFLTPSGMSTLYVALRTARRYQMSKYKNQGGTAVVFGFPYLDTLKLCSRPELVPEGVEFFGHGGDQDMSDLERFLETRRVGVLFTEVPSNPLLKCPDMFKLRELCDKHDVLLVVDDTISNFANVDLIQTGLADVICSSLTKIVSGRGDVMAGSVVANPHTERGRLAAQDLQEHHDDNDLYYKDAAALARNATDFTERNSRINETTSRLAKWFRAHSDVNTVYFPEQEEHYTPLLRPNGGYGGLLSIVLEPHVCQRTFFDQLDVAKGPSLGTNFTLACPYTLLAHYHELDFAMTYDVPPNLIRIAIGLEDYDMLENKISEALDSARLYPKVSNS